MGLRKTESRRRDPRFPTLGIVASRSGALHEIRPRRSDHRTPAGPVAGGRQESVLGGGVPGRPLPGLPGHAGRPDARGPDPGRGLAGPGHGGLRPQRGGPEEGQDDQVRELRRARPAAPAQGDAGLARRPRGELQGGGDHRRPGDGQGPVHADPVQPPRPRPGPARDRRLDRRRPPRPLRHAPQGVGRRPGDRPGRPAGQADGVLVERSGS